MVWPPARWPLRPAAARAGVRVLSGGASRHPDPRIPHMSSPIARLVLASCIAGSLSAVAPADAALHRR